MSIGCQRIYIGEKIINMSDGDAEQVDDRAAPEQHREPQQDPWQVRRSEVEEAQKAHLLILVPIAPYVDHHEGQGVSQKGDIDERRCHEHERSTEQHHIEE